MPKVVLHVGTHKTGTTALQNSLNESRAALEACGICYDPSLGGRKSRAAEHHALARLLGEPDSDDTQHLLTGYRSFIQRQLYAGHNVVISSERFYRMKVDARLGDSDARRRYMECVGRFFAGLPVEVIVYFRRPDTFIESLYKERATKPKPLSFEDCIAPNFAVNYAQRLSEFDAVFEKVSCFCFEHAVAQGLVQQFLRRHGLADGDLEESGVRRKGVSFRAALWLQARKKENPTATRLVQEMWLFCLDMEQHPLLRDSEGDRPWKSLDQRTAFYSRMVEGFKHADFWSSPEDKLSPIDPRTVDLEAIDEVYTDWLARNRTRLELRWKHKVAPYSADPEAGLGKRFAVWTEHRLRALAGR
jgi:hypothetical protein